MKLKESMYRFLKKTPQARYRKHLYKVIGRIMQEEHIRFRDFPIDLLKDYVAEIISLDRQFRLVMGENNWWSEEDKKESKILQQKKQLELGYEVDFNRDIKMFEKL